MIVGIQKGTIILTTTQKNLVRSYTLYKILYPKRRIETYIMGTIVSPNKILLKRMLFKPQVGRGLQQKQRLFAQPGEGVLQLGGFLKSH